MTSTEIKRRMTEMSSKTNKAIDYCLAASIVCAMLICALLVHEAFVR